MALDPLSVAAHLGLSRSCVTAGHLQEAEAAISKAIDLGPSTGFVHATLGRIRLLQGRPAEALAAFRVEALDYLQMYGVALAQHALEHPQKSDAALAALIARYSDTCAYQIAEVYAFRDEIELAFDSLARAYDLRDHGLSHLKGSFCERHLHGDSRWQPFRNPFSKKWASRTEPILRAEGSVVPATSKPTTRVVSASSGEILVNDVILPLASRLNTSMPPPRVCFAAMRNARLSSTTKSTYPSSFLNRSFCSPVFRLWWYTS